MSCYLSYYENLFVFSRTTNGWRPWHAFVCTTKIPKSAFSTWCEKIRNDCLEEFRRNYEELTKCKKNIHIHLLRWVHYMRLSEISFKIGKKCIFCVLGPFWAYPGQPHGHIVGHFDFFFVKNFFLHHSHVNRKSKFLG